MPYMRVAHRPLSLATRRARRLRVEQALTRNPKKKKKKAGALTYLKRRRGAILVGGGLTLLKGALGAGASVAVKAVSKAAGVSMNKKKHQVEVLKASRYYGRHATGWVVLVDGHVVLHGDKMDAERIAARFRSNPRLSRAQFRRTRIASPKEFDPRSFRTIAPGSGKHRLVVACPRGQYQGGRCKVGTEVQAVLRAKENEWAKNPLLKRFRLLDAAGNILAGAAASSPREAFAGLRASFKRERRRWPRKYKLVQVTTAPLFRAGGPTPARAAGRKPPPGRLETPGVVRFEKAIERRFGARPGTVKFKWFEAGKRNPGPEYHEGGYARAMAEARRAFRSKQRQVGYIQLGKAEAHADSARASVRTNPGVDPVKGAHRARGAEYEGDELGLIMAYEAGELDDEAIIGLFARLIKTGLVWKLQGHYGRTAKQLIDGGCISASGDILVRPNAPRAWHKLMESEEFSKAKASHDRRDKDMHIGAALAHGVSALEKNPGPYIVEFQTRQGRTVSKTFSQRREAERYAKYAHAKVSGYSDVTITHPVGRKGKRMTNNPGPTYHKRERARYERLLAGDLKAGHGEATEYWQGALSAEAAAVAAGKAKRNPLLMVVPNAVKRTGSQALEPLAETEYRLIGRKGGVAILWDPSAKKLEAWGANKHFAGYAIGIGNTAYEFLRTVSQKEAEQLLSSRPRPGASTTYNPERPPEGWWKRCVAGVKASGGAYDPKEVCGSLWFHKMSRAQRKAAIEAEENPAKRRRKKRKPSLLEREFEIPVSPRHLAGTGKKEEMPFAKLPEVAQRKLEIPLENPDMAALMKHPDFAKGVKLHQELHGCGPENVERLMLPVGGKKNLGRVFMVALGKAPSESYLVTNRRSVKKKGQIYVHPYDRMPVKAVDVTGRFIATLPGSHAVKKGAGQDQAWING